MKTLYWVFVLGLALPGVWGQGVITTLAGNGTCAFTGDGGQAALATLCHASNPGVDRIGNIYFADRTNFRIRKISLNGTISTIAGTGVPGSSGDGGPALSARLGNIHQLDVAEDGYVVFGDLDAHKVRVVFLNSGTIQGVGTGAPVSGGNDWSNASFNIPSGVTSIYYPQGCGESCSVTEVLIAESVDNLVRHLKADGVFTIAGPGTPGQLGDGGPATQAYLNAPVALAGHGSSLYVADRNNHRIRRIDLVTGIITTVAGTGVAGFSGDGGPAANAQLSAPNGLAVDAYGTLYISDQGNLRVRRVGLEGRITTVAGNGTSGLGGDNIPAMTSSFAELSGIGWDFVARRLLIADGNRIRQIPVTATSTTLTSSPAAPQPGDTVTLTATVSPAPPEGQVSFRKDTGELLGSATVNSGVATLQWISPVPVTFSAKATYEGNPTHSPSVSNGRQIDVRLHSTVNLVSNRNPSLTGEQVTFTATVAPANATGTVLFHGVGPNQSPFEIGYGTYSNGIATISTSALQAGVNTIYALYSGSAAHRSSSSPALLQYVQITTTTNLTAAPNPAQAGTAVTLTARVSPSTAGGRVDFYAKGALVGEVTQVGSAQLNGGVAVLVWTPVTGIYTLTSVYVGDALHRGSSSEPVSFIVVP
ncbi:MAG: Ig-like domain repeat protein [Acidobacteriia bacterium]|nr:Ig-like domain repeat protein [Terriglobia bacterium]